MNKKTVKIFLLCFSFMLFSLLVYSGNPPTPGQKGYGNGNGNNGNGHGNQPPPPGLPIDGGLSFLLASGVIYGIYSLKRKK